MRGFILRWGSAIWIRQGLEVLRKLDKQRMSIQSKFNSSIKEQAIGSGQVDIVFLFHKSSIKFR